MLFEYFYNPHIKIMSGKFCCISSSFNCNPVALEVNSGHYHFALLEDLALDLVFLLKLVSAVEGPLVFDGVEVFDAVVGVLVWLASSRK